MQAKSDLVTTWSIKVYTAQPGEYTPSHGRLLYVFLVYDYFQNIEIIANKTDQKQTKNAMPAYK